jgi:hypothetical protein
MSLRRIRRAAREERYEFTQHAVEEMDEDDLTDAEVREVLLRGHVIRELSDDARGERFVLRGRPRGREQAEVEVVCRFLCSERLRIITVYAMRE